MKRTTGLHPQRQTERARQAFAEVRGTLATEARAREIAALPVIEWRGRTLRTIRCDGPYGRGPHAVNVPESLLWWLMSLQRFRCPYHP